MITMKAKFGSCSFCHIQFVVNEETINYDPNVKKAFHVSCPPVVTPMYAPQPLQATRRNIMLVPTKTDIVESQVLPDLTKLFDGKFAIPCQLKDQTKTHLSIRVDTVKPDKKYAGSRNIRVHFGRHDGQKFIDVAFIPVGGKLTYYKSFISKTEMNAEKKHIVREAVKLLLEGTENPIYALEYARICRKCWHCNMDLVAFDTLQKLEENCGLGPVCVKKYPMLKEKITEQAVKSEPYWIKV